MGTHWASLGHTWVLILACHITHPSTHFPPNCKHSLSTHDSVLIEGWGHVWIKRFAHSRSSRSIDMKYKCTFCLDYTVTRLCLPSSGFPPLSTYFTSSSSPVMQQHGPETPAESFFFFFVGVLVTYLLGWKQQGLDAGVDPWTWPLAALWPHLTSPSLYFLICNSGIIWPTL